MGMYRIPDAVGRETQSLDRREIWKLNLTAVLWKGAAAEGIENEKWLMLPFSIQDSPVHGRTEGCVLFGDRKYVFSRLLLREEGEWE
jgi:hypothetical protein